VILADDVGHGKARMAVGRMSGRACQERKFRAGRPKPQAGRLFLPNRSVVAAPHLRPGWIASELFAGSRAFVSRASVMESAVPMMDRDRCETTLVLPTNAGAV